MVEEDIAKELEEQEEEQAAIVREELKTMDNKWKKEKERIRVYRVKYSTTIKLLEKRNMKEECSGIASKKRRIQVPREKESRTKTTSIEAKTTGNTLQELLDTVMLVEEWRDQGVPGTLLDKDQEEQRPLTRSWTHTPSKMLFLEKKSKHVTSTIFISRKVFGGEGCTLMTIHVNVNVGEDDINTLD